MLIDSSFLFSLQDVTDPYHKRSRLFAYTSPFEPLVPEVGLNEVAYLVRHRLGIPAVVYFLETFPELGIQTVSLIPSDYPRIAEIMHTYQSAAFDFVDCAMMALAERLSITHICTYDRRDFSIFRPRHCDFFTLLPD